MPKLALLLFNKKKAKVGQLGKRMQKKRRKKDRLLNSLQLSR